MSKDLYNVTLLELLPENLRHDPDIIAASKAADEEFTNMVQTINVCQTISNIDDITDENILDLIVIERNADYYDQTLPIEKKRIIAKNAYIYHFFKGTPFAVEQLITDIFGEAELVEWYQYGGQPYHFKIIVKNSAVSNELQDQFLAALKAIKNKRSVLEELIIGYVCSINLFCSENLIII